MSQRRRPRNLYDQFQCPCCKEWYDEEGFYRNKRTLDGISTYCKTCQREKQKYYSPRAKQERTEQREADALISLQEQLEEFRTLLEQRTQDPQSK